VSSFAGLGVSVAVRLISTIASSRRDGLIADDISYLSTDSEQCFFAVLCFILRLIRAVNVSSTVKMSANVAWLRSITFWAEGRVNSLRTFSAKSDRRKCRRFKAVLRFARDDDLCVGFSTPERRSEGSHASQIRGHCRLRSAQLHWLRAFGAFMTATDSAVSPSVLIDRRIEQLGDWRGEMLATVRKLIHAANPEVVEEWKWRGVPVFSHNGILCTGETYKSVVKLTFARGAALPDPAGLFNSSLEGNVRRAIDIHEGETIDEAALKALIKAAVSLNLAKKKSR
jgi:hypothetical protein